MYVNIFELKCCQGGRRFGSSAKNVKALACNFFFGNVFCLLLFFEITVFERGI
jgi:hypothetical protein